MQISSSGVSAATANRTIPNTTKTTNNSAVEQTPPSTPAAQVQLSEAAQKPTDTRDLPRYLQPISGYVDPYASVGSVYDYLRPSDQKALKEAYDYAREHGTSQEKVEEAAFFLGVQRNKEARINAGTQYSFHVSEDAVPFLNAKPEDRAEELSKLMQNDPDNQFYRTLLRAEQGNFFGGDNPVLQQSLFTDAVDSHLGPFRSNTVAVSGAYSLPDRQNDPESLLLNHLSGADKSELSRAYQNARDNNLDPDEVRKASLLLAVQRMNENMTKTLDDNSIAGQAVKASSGLFQSEIDTPKKLIDLAEKVLGEDAADSFRQLVGQPSSEEVFGRNSTLRQTLFLAPAYNLLNMTLNG